MSPECQHYNPASKEYPRVGTLHLWVLLSHPPTSKALSCLWDFANAIPCLEHVTSPTPSANSKFTLRPLISSPFLQWFSLSWGVAAPERSQRLRHLPVTVFTTFDCYRLLSWLCSPLDQKLMRTGRVTIFSQCLLQGLVIHMCLTNPCWISK